MKRIAYFLLIAVVLVGCKSSKRLTATKVPEVAASEAAIPSYLASSDSCGAEPKVSFERSGD